MYFLVLPQQSSPMGLYGRAQQLEGCQKDIFTAMKISMSFILRSTIIKYIKIHCERKYFHPLSALVGYIKFSSEWILYLQHDAPKSKIFQIYHYKNIYNKVKGATMCVNASTSMSVSGKLFETKHFPPMLKRVEMFRRIKDL